MTEAQAWREIARRIVDRQWSRLGLCREVWNLLRPAPLPRETARTMIARATRHVESSGKDIGEYVYPEGTEREARALAALWLALEAEEEGA